MMRSHIFFGRPGLDPCFCCPKQQITGWVDCHREGSVIACGTALNADDTVRHRLWGVGWWFFGGCGAVCFFFSFLFGTADDKIGQWCSIGGLRLLKVTSC